MYILNRTANNGTGPFQKLPVVNLFLGIQGFGLFAKLKFHAAVLEAKHCSPHRYWKREKSSRSTICGGSVGLPLKVLTTRRKPSKRKRKVAAYTCSYSRRADGEILGKTGFHVLVHTPTACPVPWGPVEVGATDGTETAVGRHSGAGQKPESTPTHMAAPSSVPWE